MEPTSRLILEVMFEAICDAGINPSDMQNMNTAVFGALSMSESDKCLFYEKLEVSK